MTLKCIYFFSVQAFSCSLNWVEISLAYVSFLLPTLTPLTILIEPPSIFLIFLRL